MRAVPFFVLALALGTTACLIPRGGAGAGTNSGSSGYASSGGGGGSYGNDGSDGTAYGATPASAETNTAPAGPVTVSVTIRSSCDHTVPVFYGEKPGFSSGTRSSVSSNSVSSQTFQVGDLMWVLDDSDQPLSSTSISASTREIEINSSCSGLSAR